MRREQKKDDASWTGTKAQILRTKMVSLGDNANRLTKTYIILKAKETTPHLLKTDTNRLRLICL